MTKKLYENKLTKKDSVIQKRARALAKLLGLAGDKKENLQAVQVEIQKFTEVKLKLQDIEQDIKLYGYYDGFMSTFRLAYDTALAVASGHVVLDTDPDKILKLGSMLISFIPFIGKAVSDTFNSICEFLKGAQMIKNANNVWKFAPSHSNFDTIVQDALIEIITKKKDYIRNFQDGSPEIKNWMTKIQAFCNKVKTDLEETIYGWFKTDYQRLGNKEANELLSEWICTGKIYNNKPAVSVLPETKKSELVRIAMELKHDATEKLEKIEPSYRAKSSCCSIF